MGKKTWKKTVCALLAAILLLAAMPLAGAEEPHGDGNGILSHPGDRHPGKRDGDQQQRLL